MDIVLIVLFKTNLFMISFFWKKIKVCNSIFDHNQFYFKCYSKIYIVR